MTHCHEVLCAGQALVLPSGQALLLVSRSRTVVQGRGWWRMALVRREPHALLVQEADGRVRVMAAGSEAVSLTTLGLTVPPWEGVLRGLDERAPRAAAGADCGPAGQAQGRPGPPAP